MHQNKIILKTSKAHVRSMCNQTQDQFPKKHLSVHRHHKIYIVQSYVEIFRPKNEKKQNKTKNKNKNKNKKRKKERSTQMSRRETNPFNCENY
jgi:hypothetical protein